MQRKNYLLNRKKREGFAIFMAIGVMVAIATIMAFSIEMTMTTGKRVVDLYVQNQADIYAKNAAEYALYKIKESSTNCNPVSVPEFVIDDIYHISVDIKYAYSNEDCGAGNYINLIDAPDDRKYAYVKLDVNVTVDQNATNSPIAEPMRIYKRYIEDITPYIN